MVHRSYLNHGMIQVVIYDDRLKITSLENLPMGQIIERMKEGYSKIRNEALVYAFFYMNLIEHCGSGIPRIIGKVKAAGLREQIKKLLVAIEENPSATQAYYAEQIGVSKRTVYYDTGDHAAEGEIRPTYDGGTV